MVPGEKMFKDLSIKKKLYLSFGAILAIILVLLSIAYKQFSSLSEANEWYRHTMDVIHSIDQLQLDLLQVQVEARGYYLTGSPERLERTRTEMGDLPASILKLQKLTLDNPVQVERFKKLEAMIGAWTKDVITWATSPARRARWATPRRCRAAIPPSARSTNSWKTRRPRNANCWRSARPRRPTCRRPCGWC